MSEPATETVTLRMELAGRALEANVTLPTAPVPATAMVPVVHALTDEVVRRIGDVLAAQGTPVSCRAGCAACCRKLVPVSATEARRLPAIVASLPEELRARIEDRAARARLRLGDAGLLGALDRPPPGNGLDDDAVVSLSEPYFALWIDCPFLEDERCAIYAERPAACREYAVVSPARACFPDASETTVEGVRLPMSFSNSLRSLDTHGWVPLALALGRTLPAEPAARAGVAWLEALTAPGT